MQTWHDIKGKAKNKKAGLAKHLSITGSGPPSGKEITNEDDMVLSMINPTAIEGHSQIEESIVCFDGTFSFDYENNPTKIDHDYADVSHKKNIVRDIEKAASSSNRTEDEHPCVSENPKKKIKLSKSERLSKTVLATETLADQNRSFLKIKKWYYEKKIALKEAEVHEKRRIADALEKIAS